MQNVGIRNVRISNSKDGPGIVLTPLRMFSFTDCTMYAWCDTKDGTQLVIIDSIPSNGNMSKDDLLTVKELTDQANESAVKAQQAASDAETAAKNINDKTVLATADGINFSINRNNGLSVSVENTESEK